jgi:CRP-like cAMP-binding protein
MTSAKDHYLATVDILQDLTDDERSAVGNSTRLVKYPANYLFYMPGDTAEMLFILKVGRVQLYRMSPDGRKLIIATLAAGAIFGQMALVGQRLYRTYAQALDEVVICVWNRDEVEQLIVQKPQVALRFLAELGQRVLHAEDRWEETTFKRVPARLAGLLLRLAQANVVAGYTHQALAEMLGVYRETVTQILQQFKAAEWVQIERRRVVLLDLVALTQAAADVGGQTPAAEDI